MGRQPAQCIHVMCSHYQLSLLALHQSGDSINPCSKDRWSLGGDIAFAGSFLLIRSQQLLFLLLLCLWPALGGQLKHSSSCLVVQGLAELLNRRRHFQALIENSPLLLQPNVTFDKVSETPFGLDVRVQCQNPWVFSQIGDLSSSWPPASSQLQGLGPLSSP